MCIIFFDARESTDRLSREVLARAVEKNPDGMGIMYAVNNRLYTWRTMSDFEGLCRRYESCRQRQIPVALHFREASHRIKDRTKTLTENNCHPFLVNQQLGVMHNGTMSELLWQLPEGISDTQFLCSEVLQHLPSDFMYRQPFITVIDKFMGTDRLVLMNNKGHYNIINESVGGWVYGESGKGVWVSHWKDRAYILYGESDWERTQRERREKWAKEEAERKERTAAAARSKSTEETQQKQLLAPARASVPVRRSAVVPSSAHRPVLSLKAKRKIAKRSAILDNVLFGYGSFRDDVGVYAMLPKNVDMIGTGMLRGAQLWAVEQGKDIGAGAIPRNNPTFVIHGCLYRLNGNKHMVNKSLNHLDAVMGCDMEAQDESYYTRHKYEVEWAGLGGADVSAWVYIPNMDETITTLVAPVPRGDWREWLNGEMEAIEALKSVDNTIQDKPLSKAPSAPVRTVNSEGLLVPDTGNAFCPKGCTGRDTSLFVSVSRAGTIKRLYCYECRTEFPLDGGFDKEQIVIQS